MWRERRYTGEFRRGPSAEMARVESLAELVIMFARTRAQAGPRMTHQRIQENEYG